MNAENFQFLLDLVGPAISKAGYIDAGKRKFYTLDSMKNLGFTGRTYGSTVHTTRMYGP